ncbi:hypothetical protein LX36DRAFT_289362 [Colletotrichum falcatum]|nr:hypothetical protein LX36DRAFT_289362 [Colletotrichum falcatum]
MAKFNYVAGRLGACQGSSLRPLFGQSPAGVSLKKRRKKKKVKQGDLLRCRSRIEMAGDAAPSCATAQAVAVLVPHRGPAGVYLRSAPNLVQLRSCGIVLRPCHRRGADRGARRELGAASSLQMPNVYVHFGNREVRGRQCSSKGTLRIQGLMHGVRLAILDRVAALLLIEHRLDSRERERERERDRCQTHSMRVRDLKVPIDVSFFASTANGTFTKNGRGAVGWQSRVGASSKAHSGSPASCL